MLSIVFDHASTTAMIPWAVPWVRITPSFLVPFATRWFSSSALVSVGSWPASSRAGFSPASVLAPGQLGRQLACWLHFFCALASRQLPARELIFIQLSFSLNNEVCAVMVRAAVADHDAGPCLSCVHTISPRPSSCAATVSHLIAVPRVRTMPSC